jgi:hypothetical protein
MRSLSTLLTLNGRIREYEIEAADEVVGVVVVAVDLAAMTDVAFKSVDR